MHPAHIMAENPRSGASLNFDDYGNHGFDFPKWVVSVRDGDEQSQSRSSVSELGPMDGPPLVKQPPADAEFAGGASIRDWVLGPTVGERGYFVGKVEGNLYRISDESYQCAFMTTSDGVVLFDAPAALGRNIQRAVDEVALASGVSNKVAYLIYSHHHADHAGASALFDRDVIRIGHEETRNLLLRDDDPARPVPEETFQDCRTLDIGGERIELVWHGPNHSPDNIFIHFPDHAALMVVDIVNPGWAAVCQSNLAHDVPGYIEAAGYALTYPWKHFIGGHRSRIGTRSDLVLHRQYLADIVESSHRALDSIDPAPFFQEHSAGAWASVNDYLTAAAAAAAAPVIEKYAPVLAASDLCTTSTAFQVMQSIRLDFGYGPLVHP
jgi:glyoxylase-like metal-dependent hydrolase (beta-lactamase superfamily II)